MTQPIDAMLAALAQLQTQLAALAGEHAAHRQAALPARVRARLSELDAHFSPQLETLEVQIAAQTTQLKAAVLAHGHSCTGHGLQAVYRQGRVSWDDRALQGYATVHPEIVPFRAVGAASVSVRQATAVAAEAA